MSEMSEGIQIRTGFDRELAWQRGGSYRYLVANLEAPSVERPATRRPPLHLALVIDRSGSMGGPRIEAAKQAAIGVTEQLRPEDHLSVVSFDDRVEVLCERQAMDTEGKRIATAAIAALEARAMTNLSEGWLSGAECLARSMERGFGLQCRVVTLTDGKANQGILHGDELAHHASELRQRGIVSSAVGIGDDYAPDHLLAIAESGGGNVHDAELPDEIAAMVMGELGETLSTFADDLVLEIGAPAGVELVCWNRFPLSRTGESWECSLGALPASTSRRVVFTVRTPAGPLGASLAFRVAARWRVPGSQELRRTPASELRLTFVRGHENSHQPRDIARSLEVARVWQARLIREATELNRRHDFHGVRRLLRHELRHLERYCSGLPGGEELVHDTCRLRGLAERPLHERNLKQLGWLAYSEHSGRSDYSLRERGSWTNHLEG
ncbi:MAG: VWA domain-containing protein [Deltaproteobacteria bacterium]|nr:VWA domain-containing protein [Deltaproteobacteria bacterium]MBW2418024.1 VWA domain-containing protein [Deltaproteobacteria bacterium]